jgi:predicted kinase
MGKMQLAKPTLFLMYGFPGSGKTYFARQMCDELQAAHVSGDRIRGELFEEPRYDKAEDRIVTQLMQYMTEEFLNAGVSVVFDTNAMRIAQRRTLRDLARKSKADTVLIWFQVDADTSYQRNTKRDRRKADDKYAQSLDRGSFDKISQGMQNPTTTEDYIVVSGKHTYQSQRGAVIRKLYATGLLQADQTQAALPKPNLVNLVPSPFAGRVDPSRRNIRIN